MRWLAAVCVLGACDGGPAMQSVCREPARISAKGNAGYGGFDPLTELPLMAVGGTSSVRLYCNTPSPLSDCGNSCPLARFDLPYEIEVRDGPVWFAGPNQEGDPVFYAAGEGSGTLAFVDPDDASVYADVAVRALELDQLTLKRVHIEREPSDLEVVLATEQPGPQFDIVLSSANGESLVDESLEMELPSGVERLATSAIYLHDLATGSYELGFRAGRRSFTETLEIVNEADAIELWQAPATIPRYPIMPGTQEYVCFLAKSRERYITGLRWHHTVDGMPAEIGSTLNCVLAATYQPSGSPVTFTASAGGRSLTVQIPAR